MLVPSWRLGTRVTTLTDQQKIADGFAKASRGIFDCCAGAIDGILVWMEQPSQKHCELSGCGAKKFFCRRKKKFGLNMQATCDHNKRFLDIYLKHPASTSDYLSFCSSPLFCKLEQADFMKPGLCIFGDNAYCNTPYMATPYKGAAVKGGSKDAYNFFHSNCRITIECAFGMLVHRWGILCKPMSTKLPVSKVTAIVRCLCRLHNFFALTRGSQGKMTAVKLLHILTRTRPTLSLVVDPPFLLLATILFRRKLCSMVESISMM
jgi:DDE superfamily endonuclease